MQKNTYNEQKSVAYYNMILKCQIYPDGLDVKTQYKSCQQAVQEFTSIIEEKRNQKLNNAIL